MRDIINKNNNVDRLVVMTKHAGEALKGRTLRKTGRVVRRLVPQTALFFGISVFEIVEDAGGKEYEVCTTIGGGELFPPMRNVMFKRLAEHNFKLGR